MVDRLFHRGKMVFLCEYCGFGYEEEEASETCEAFCGTHGSCSAKLTRLAIYTPPVMVIPAADN